MSLFSTLSKVYGVKASAKALGKGSYPKLWVRRKLINKVKKETK